MRKLLLTSITSALLLAVVATSATAIMISVSNRQFRVVWRDLVFNGGGSTIHCPLTFEGSFHSSTIRKVERALIGFVTRSTTVPSSCTNGRATVNLESLPWHMTYRAFAGTLPNITGAKINLLNAKFTINTGGIECISQTEATHPSIATAELEAGGRITGLRADESAGIPLRGNFLCGLGGEGTIGGTGAITLQGNTQAITVDLIGETANLIKQRQTPGENRITLTLKNETEAHTGADITITNIAASPRQYTVQDSNTCRGRTLAPQRQCVFAVVRDLGSPAGEVTAETTVGRKTEAIEA